jgi:hypothetical protein
VPERKPDTGPPALLDPDAIRLPFLVDDYFVPNGCFGDANCQNGVIEINGRGCPAGVPPGQSVCRAFTYQPLATGTPGYQGFLGVLFQDVGPKGEDDIGRVPGLAVEPGAQRVTFSARVALGAGVQGATIAVAFRAGGANNWEGNTDPALPYKDDFGVPQDAVLTTTFQRVEIDLSGVSYRKVVSPFGWAIESAGRTDAIELDIADVRWE